MERSSWPEKRAQKDFSVAIGTNVGVCNQNSSAIAIGNQAGYSGQGSQSIAIGLFFFGAKA